MRPPRRLPADRMAARVAVERRASGRVVRRGSHRVGDERQKAPQHELPGAGTTASRCRPARVVSVLTQSRHRVRVSHDTCFRSPSTSAQVAAGRCSRCYCWCYLSIEKERNRLKSPVTHALGKPCAAWFCARRPRRCSPLGIAVGRPYKARATGSIPVPPILVLEARPLRDSPHRR